MGLELLAYGALSNLFYASAGYFKARQQENAKFDWKSFVRTVVIGFVPPVIVLGIEYFGMPVPADQVISALGPVLDKALKAFGF